MQLRLVLSCCLVAAVVSVPASVAPVSAAIQAAPERVEVKRGTSWYPATVIKREGNKALVHYEGLSKDFDEWVGPERMREAAVRPQVAPEPAKPAPGPAAKPKPDQEAAPPEAEEEATEPGETPKKLTRANYSGAKRINGDLSTAPDLWQLAADGLTDAQAKVSMGPIALFRENEGPEKSRRFGENLESPLFAGPGVARAVIPRYWHMSHGEGTACRVELLDLGVGRSVNFAEMPVDTKVLDFSADGESVLLYNEKWGDDQHTRLDIFSVGGKKAVHAISWEPYGDEPEREQAVKWAAFVDNTHVLTVSGKEKAVLWEWAKARAIYTLQLDQMGTPVLSPGHKYFLIGGNHGITVHEAMTGKLVAAQKNEHLWGSQFHFRPDGKQFAGKGWGRVTLWDFETGKQVGEYWMPPKVGHFGFDWLSGDYAMLDGHYLLDLTRGIVLWDYTRRGMEGGVYAGRYWYMTDGSAVFSHVLASAVLPHPAVKKETANLKPEDYLVVRPGVSVSVEINIEAPPEGREKVVKSIESKLKANGLTIADGQPLKLIATTTPGESRELSYHLFGSPGYGKVTVNEKKLRVAFELDGKAIWENTNVSGAGGMFSLKKDQTVEQAIAERMAEAWHFFENVELPKQVAGVGEKVGYGASRLTARGIQEGDEDQPGAPTPGGTRRPMLRGPRRMR
jgi:hypothetical protein